MYQLAQINVAKIKGKNINDPVMKEFVDNLDKINGLAESSEGFVWRLKDESNHAANFNPYDDEQVIINISVWEDVESLQHFTFKTHHVDFVKRRKEWFSNFGKAYYALWWIKQGGFPSIEECVKKLKDLENNGPSEDVFNFKKTYPKPEVNIS